MKWRSDASGGALGSSTVTMSLKSLLPYNVRPLSRGGTRTRPTKHYNATVRSGALLTMVRGRLRCMKLSVAYRMRAVPIAFECYEPHRPPVPMPELL